MVGRAIPHPADGRGLDEHVRQIIGRENYAVTLLGGIPYRQVVSEYAQADICVFCSEWEASGYVCIEAMAAARGVIGSSAGGMAEIIEHGSTGLLVPPRDPHALAEAIISLLSDPVRRIRLATRARQYAITAFTPDVVGPMQEASYARAIEQAKARRRTDGSVIQ